MYSATKVMTVVNEWIYSTAAHVYASKILVVGHYDRNSQSFSGTNGQCALPRTTANDSRGGVILVIQHFDCKGSTFEV